MNIPWILFIAVIITIAIGVGCEIAAKYKDKREREFLNKNISSMMSSDINAEDTIKIETVHYATISMSDIINGKKE